MENEVKTIKCPECGVEIDVNEILYHQVEDELKRSYEAKIAQKETDYQKKLKELNNEKTLIEQQRENLQSQVDTEVKTKMYSEKTKLEKSIRQQVNDEKSGQVKSLEDELRNKSEQVKDLNRIRGELAREQREKAELKDKIEADAEQKFSKLLAQEKEKIKSAETEKSKTELQKRDKLIDDLNNRLEEAQTRLASGSNKLAGEVKEIELADLLKSIFPSDEINDFPSGSRGADVFQTVKNNTGQVSGIILYERKQTQRFDEKWVSKLKDDGRSIKADICLVVSRAMPKDCEEPHFRDGVWICCFEDVKIVTMLLRDGLIKQYSALSSQMDKGTKMEMLYNYLRSNEFQNHVRGMLDAFRKMDKSLHKEREDALKKFAEREAHIFQAKQSVLNFWGRVDGIATDSLNQEMKILAPSQEENGVS
ncbi:MAG: DUF2130 domain-containing protein [Chitinophagales bacterium]